MNNSSSFQEEVVLTENGEVYNPIEIDLTSVIGKIVCCSIGIPLNISIAVTITRLRRLHRKPRNFFLLGIILSYLSFFIVPIIELIYWRIYPDESLCRAYVAVIFVPQGLLLVNMLLALIDRYLAINHPLLHREKMTNRLACCLVVTCSILMVFLFKFIYIVGLGILRCEILLLQVKTATILFIILFGSCTAMNIIIHRLTKILLRESRIVEATRDQVGVSSDIVTANNQHSTVVSPMSIHVGRKKLGQLEMEATQTLVIGVTSLCVMPCLSFVFMATFFACRLVFGHLECSNLNGIGFLIKEISLTPAVYGPIIFLVRNKELRAALTCQIIR
jgi:dopamine receptor D1